MKSSRTLAVQILKPLFAEPPSGNLNDQFDTYLGNNSNDKNNGLIRELCFGVCRYYLLLLAIAHALLKKPFKKKDKDLEILILLGIYQLRFTRIPNHAAINETVSACVALNKSWAKGLVNGVLRHYVRDKSAIETNLDRSIHIQSSHPDWLVKILKNDWPDQYQEILAANNQPAPLTLRINIQMITRAKALQSFSAANVSAMACRYAPEGVTLNKAIKVETIPGFKKGMSSVQDESAQLAASLLKIEPGHRVLDACAAPGGKTSHILEKHPQIKQLVALDKSAPRLEKVRSNLLRLKLDATLIAADAGNLEEWWDNQPFQRILLDAPCSATGIIRRHPDIKWLRKAEDISALAQLQLHLLNTLWTTLAPGGVLLYATCSVLKQEDEMLVARFLKNQRDAKEDMIEANWGFPTSVGRQIFPKPEGQDGFYYARLTKCAL